MPPSLAQQVGLRIRAFRLQRELSQMKLAERAGLQLDGVSRIERGVRSARLETLEKIAHALGVGVPDLVDVGKDSAVQLLPEDLREIVEPLRGQPAGLRRTAKRLVEVLVEESDRG